MLAGDAAVAMPQGLGHQLQVPGGHQQQLAVGRPGGLERDALQLRRLDRGGHGLVHVILAPGAAVVAQEDVGLGITARGQGVEQGDALGREGLGQDLAGLGLEDPDRCGVGVVGATAQVQQLATPGAGHQGAQQQLAQVRGCGVQQAGDFVLFQHPRLRLVAEREGIDLHPVGRQARRELIVLPGAVERGLDHAQYPVRRGLARTHLVQVGRVEGLGLAAGGGCLGDHGPVPLLQGLGVDRGDQPGADAALDVAGVLLAGDGLGAFPGQVFVDVVDHDLVQGQPVAIVARGRVAVVDLDRLRPAHGLGIGQHHIAVGFAGVVGCPDATLTVAGPLALAHDPCGGAPALAVAKEGARHDLAPVRLGARLQPGARLAGLQPVLPGHACHAGVHPFWGVLGNKRVRTPVDATVHQRRINVQVSIRYMIPWRTSADAGGRQTQPFHGSDRGSNPRGDAN